MSIQVVHLLEYVSSLEQRVNINQQNCTSEGTRNLVPSPRISIFNDCHDVFQLGYKRSGVYMIHIFHGFYPLPIFCDMETSGTFCGRRGWMIIQKRTDGKVSFDRSWKDYLNGFGFPDKDHWLGLRNIANILQQKAVGKYGLHNPVLRIDVEDWDGIEGFMEHDSFSLSSEDSDFKISNLGKYKTTPGLGDHLGFSLYSPFSTHDHNNDRRRKSLCIQTQKGGWWFGSCYNSNLNGVYAENKQRMSDKTMFLRNWKSVNANNTAFRSVSMKLQ